MLKNLFNFIILSTTVISNTSFCSNSINNSSDELSLSTTTHTTQESISLDSLPNEIKSSILSYLDPKELAKARSICHQLQDLSEELQKIENKELFLSLKNNTGASVKLKFTINLDNMYTEEDNQYYPTVTSQGQINSKYQTLEDGKILSLSKKDVDAMVRNSEQYMYQLDKFSPNDSFTGRNIFSVSIDDDRLVEPVITGVCWDEKRPDIIIDCLTYLDVEKSVTKPFNLNGNPEDGFKVEE